MVGNSISVTGAPAPMPAPSVSDARQLAAAQGGSTGNTRSAAGQDLPPPVHAADAADIDRALSRLRELMADQQRNLDFRVDEASGRTVITVLDATTEEVVRQIPAEEVLVIARTVGAAGALLDARI